jgi:hypothetical protein
MRKKAVMFIVLGIVGVIFVCSWDIIMRKPVNDITGLKSVSALIICVALIARGTSLCLKKTK